ncbi:MAG: XkdX family protein [Clostridium sp.]
MSRVYADLLIAHRKKWAEIPLQIKESVKNILKQDVLDGHITAKTYKEIVGEEYVA